MQAPETARYFAFLRAINVGGRTIKMDRLRAIFGDLDFADIETFIASGNVIFTAPTTDAYTLERRIEEHLRSVLGYDVDTFIRTSEELDAIAKYQPFERLDDARLYVAFLPDVPDDALREKLAARETPDDEFRVHSREVYWLCRTSTHLSSFSNAVLEKLAGTPASMRNINTVHRLVTKYPLP